MTIVSTALGDIRGSITVTRRADVQSYLGIPFAEPPVGTKRFLPPVPLQPWKGLRDAIHYGPAAPQNPDPYLTSNGYHQPRTSETDCLNLNIWTPRADDKRRPVLVWIHGGANVNGSNSAGYTSGAELAATFDVVVVSINFRLGVLGFLSLGNVLGSDFATSGNAALLDQLESLRWVAENIERFGGDQHCVTIFGESAGAAAVGTLMGAPSGVGLFHRAVMQSGTAERVRSLEDADQITDRFLRHAGLTRTTALRLQDLPVQGLLAAQAALHNEDSQSAIGLSLPFQSVVDGNVLPTTPLEAIRGGLNSDTQLLVGTNLNEASLYTQKLETSGHAHPDALVEALFSQHFSDPLATRIAYEKAMANILKRTPSSIETLEYSLSDVLYRQPTNRLLDARESSLGDNFAYLFSWPSPVMDGRLGASHALELPFVFRQLHRIEAISLAGENPPSHISDAMSAAWVQFANTGQPNSAHLPSWPRYEQSHRLTMKLDLTSEVHSDPLGSLRQIWNTYGT